MPQTGSRFVFGAGCAAPANSLFFSTNSRLNEPDWTILDGSAIHTHPAAGKQTAGPQEKEMTLLDVVFKYGTPPGEKEISALNNAWEVYGVRKIKFNEAENTIRVEYDASRLSDGEIAGILRRAGIDLRDKVQLV
jgi:hypothetical protein